MNTHVDKTQENKGQSVANSVAQKLGSIETTFQFVDNRPEAVAQRKLQEMANNSPQVSQLRAFQRMVSNSPKSKQTSQLKKLVGNFSQNVIQRVLSTTALTVSPEQKAVLNGKICWDSVAYSLLLDGLITQDGYDAWGGGSEQNALARLVSLNDPQVFNPNIPANHVVGIFRDDGGGVRHLSHVMLSLGGGLCIGSNNGCIGGAANWSVQDIGSLLNWPGPRVNPDLHGNARFVHHRSGNAAAANF